MRTYNLGLELSPPDRIWCTVKRVSRPSEANLPLLLAMAATAYNTGVRRTLHTQPVRFVWSVGVLLVLITADVHSHRHRHRCPINAECPCARPGAPPQCLIPIPQVSSPPRTHARHIPAPVDTHNNQCAVCRVPCAVIAGVRFLTCASIIRVVRTPGTLLSPS